MDDKDDLNPYQAPRTEKPWHGRAVRMNPLAAPAIMMILIASPSLILFPMSGVQEIFEIVAEMKTNGEAARAGVRPLVTTIVILLVMIIGNIMTLRGAIHMLGLQKFRTAKIGAIVACLPFFSPCILLGLPFGIWALIKMHPPEVQAMFTE